MAKKKAWKPYAQRNHEFRVRSDAAKRGWETRRRNLSHSRRRKKVAVPRKKHRCPRCGHRF